MFNLFSLETVVDTAIMVSKDSEQFHKIEMKESTGSYPFQISVESGSNENLYGKSSYSCKNIGEATEKFQFWISNYLDKGFYRQSPY